MILKISWSGPLFPFTFRHLLSIRFTDSVGGLEQKLEALWEGEILQKQTTIDELRTHRLPGNLRATSPPDLEDVLHVQAAKTTP